MPISFTHILNPFLAKPGSAHALASSNTWRTLKAADSRALQHGLVVDYQAVILPGDEVAVEAPASKFAYLDRTVQDIVRLSPVRLYPLIADILKKGAAESKSSHIIFSNMDICVQPHFYLRLQQLCQQAIGPNVPFTVPRINIDISLVNAELEELYRASGPIGVGFDCFVIPRHMIEKLDLGNACIGAPHFDQLLLIALDVLSGNQVRRLNDERLTFHFGNDIAWASMLDYVEHNLAESLAAIARMKNEHAIKPGSVFDQVDRRHFQRNARTSSFLLRKLRRVPGLSTAILKVKRAIGRQY